MFVKNSLELKPSSLQTGLSLGLPFRPPCKNPLLFLVDPSGLKIQFELFISFFELSCLITVLRTTGLPIKPRGVYLLTVSSRQLGGPSSGEWTLKLCEYPLRGICPFQDGTVAAE